MSELPVGWCQAPLEDIITFSIGGLWGSEPGAPSIDSTTVAVIRGADYRNWAAKRAADAAVRNVTTKAAQTRLLEHGNLVVEVSGGGPTQPVGRVVIIDDAALSSNHLPLILSNFCRRIVVNREVLPSFVYYQLLHKYACGETERFQTATTNIRNLNFEKYASETIIRLSPRSEQARIVAAIEEQFSRLDVGIAALHRARKNVQLSRAAALEGLLYDEEDGSKFPQVPISDVLTRGRYGTSTKCAVDGEGLPVLRIPNVQAGKITLTDLKYAIDSSVDIKGSLVEEGDILIIRTNGSRSLIGKAAAVSQLPYPMAFASYLIQLRMDPARADPQYVVAALAAPSLRIRIEELAATTAGQYNINLDKIRALQIPLPSLAQQRRALSAAEARLSVADHIDEEIARALLKSKQLRSAILARAFVGRLVPQDLTEEPAPVLLERITTQRTSSNGQKSTRGRKPRVLHEGVME